MNGTFFSSTHNRILGTLVLVGLVAALGAYAYYTLKQSEYMYMGPMSITVMGEGEVLAVPDVGQFSFSVTAQSLDAPAAQAESAAKVNAIIAYLTEQGVEERDIKTEQYSLTPRYRWEERACLSGVSCIPGEQVEDGFEVSQMVTVKVRDVKQAGDLIKGVGQQGATSLSSLSFTVDNEDTLKAEARALAIADAKKNSEALAKELGVRIVRMSGYYEEERGYPMYGYGGSMMEDKVMSNMPALAAPAAAPAIPTGENEIKSRVSITFVID